MQTGVSPPPGTTGLATLPSLSTLEQIFTSKPDALATTSPSAAFAHSGSAGYPIYKSSQLPALTGSNIARRPVPSGRPGSPFSFGDPPAYPRLSPVGREGGPGRASRPWATYDQSAERERVTDTMEVEHDQSRPPPSSFNQHRHPLEHEAGPKDHFPENFDFSMRRHSIAALQSSDPHHVPGDPHAGPRSPFHPSLQGVKRKISHGSIIFGGQTPVETEFPETYRSPMDPEPPKRRGSAFGIAQMTLNERRDSADSGRFVPPGPNWWDRRDSTTSVYSNASVSSVGGYTSSYSTDSKPGWPPTNGQRGSQLPDALPTNGRPFPLTDVRTPTASTHGPAPYPDRRMSVPDASLAAGGAVRNFRSRSRPPSRGVGSGPNVTPPHLPQITASLVNSNEQYSDPNSAVSQQQQSQQPPSATSGAGNQALLSTPKDGSNGTPTPYSRSPELRVSHKLAERKRRKEMKDLFDELRDNLPADRGMKSSKWEILSKAIDYIGQMRAQQMEMSREIEILKSELDAVRGGPPPSNNHHAYGGSLGYQQGYGATPPQSRTSSHYPAAGPPPPAL